MVFAESNQLCDKVSGPENDVAVGLDGFGPYWKEVHGQVGSCLLVELLREDDFRPLARIK